MRDLDLSLTWTAPGDWPELLEASDEVDYFYDPAWARAIAVHVPGCEAGWIQARRGGRLLGGMSFLRRKRAPGLYYLYSSFEGTSGGPIVLSNMDARARAEIFIALLQKYESLLGLGGIESSFVLPARMERDFGGVLEASGWQRQAFPAAVLPLAGGFEHVEMKVMRKRRRNERNRALRWGCRGEVSTDPADLDLYYPIYRGATRLWGVRPTPKAMLADLMSGLDSGAFLSLVRWEGDVIGGHFNLHGGDRVTAWNGYTLPEYNDKFPATMLIWTDLEEACRRGAAWLDLGGSGGIENIRQFKKNLGAQEEIRVCYRRRRFPWTLRDRLKHSAGGSG